MLQKLNNSIGFFLATNSDNTLSTVLFAFFSLLESRIKILSVGTGMQEKYISFGPLALMN